MEFDNVHVHVRIYHFYHLNQIIFSDIVTHIARCIHLDVEYIERVIIIRNAMCVTSQPHHLDVGDAVGVTDDQAVVEFGFHLVGTRLLTRTTFTLTRGRVMQ